MKYVTNRACLYYLASIKMLINMHEVNSNNDIIVYKWLFVVSVCKVPRIWINTIACKGNNLLFNTFKIII